MASNPWFPRVTPMAVYVCMLLVINWAAGWSLYAQPVLKGVQLAAVAWLLWRYRRLLPELNWRFHWLAVPTGVGLCAAWVALGHGTIALSPAWFAPTSEPNAYQQMTPVLRGVSLGMALVGMTLLVPMFEELFVRSACLRGLHSPRKTWIGVVQVVEDLPVIGEWVMHTKLGERMGRYPFMFTRQLREWPVGKLTCFGVFASTAVFTINHVPRDWAGCVLCGVVWCALLWWTNRGALAEKGDGRARPALGLGPIVWSHAITNALLWGWCVWTGQWMFL